MASRISLSPLLLAVIVGGGFLAYLNFAPDNTQQRPTFNATPVRAVTVTQQAFALTIEALGTAQANESVSLTSRETDIVTSVHFDDGDFVAKGKLLVALNDDEEQGRVKELAASLDEAKRQLQRLTNLSKTNAASEQLVDEQAARVKGLQAQFEVANAQLRNFEVRAPFAGVLGVRAVSVGSLIRPADVITTLDDISRIKLDFSVAEKHLSTLALGQVVSASSVAYPGEVFSGAISSIDTRVDPVSRSVRVRALIDNASNRLRPGMLLQVTLQKAELQTLVIPEKALVPVEDRQYVFVVEGEKVRQTEVTIGERKPGWVQIIAGLSEGERIVTEGTLRIRDQSNVRVLN